MPPNRIVSVLFGLAALAAVSTGARAADVDVAKLITEGTDTVPACASCHGENGLGNADIGSPMIAGMNAEYLAATLHAFADGSRVGDTMNGIAAALTAEQITALSAFYAGLPAKAAEWPKPDQAPDLALGSKIFHSGDWPNGVPPCASCHGLTGLGLGPTFPRIAGQLPAYMAAHIGHLREDDRQPRAPAEALMVSVAKNLPPDSMAAVLAYVATLSPVPAALPGYGTADIAWAIPKMPDSPLPDAINWGAAKKAYEDQEKRVANPKAYEHTPPSFDSIPKGPLGDMIRLGRDLFSNTQKLRGIYVGNDLACSNCHMGEGANAMAAPIWATPVDFPKYRGKNMHVNTLYERIAGCFSYSMNGTPPLPQSKVMVALESYMKWLSTGIPSDAVLKARGYFYIPAPQAEPDYARGETLYKARCAMCHGSDGAGQKVGERIIFPPLWGPNSYNWGAGMHDLEKAAGFVKHNMPLGNANLTDAEVWDVVIYMNSHERPQDPRWIGSVADTRRFFHRAADTYGLKSPSGVLGDTGAPLAKPPGQPADVSQPPKLPAVAKAQIEAAKAKATAPAK